MTAPDLTVATILVAFAGVFLICFMKGAFGGGFSIVGGFMKRRNSGICFHLFATAVAWALP